MAAKYMTPEELKQEYKEWKARKEKQSKELRQKLGFSEPQEPTTPRPFVFDGIRLGYRTQCYTPRG